MTDDELAALALTPAGEAVAKLIAERDEWKRNAWDAATAERDAIVKWLWSESGLLDVPTIIEAIESGAHHQSTGGSDE